MKYSLELRNPYYYRKKFPIALLHFTAGFLLLNAWYESNIQSLIPWLGILLLAFGIFEIGYTFFAFKAMHKFPKLNGFVRLATSAAFLIYAILLFYRGQNLFAVFLLIIAIAFFIIFFIEKRWAKPFVIQIGQKGVLFPGTFKSPLIPWENFNNLILKDNVLTIDLTSNRVIQLEIRSVHDEIRIREINAFCASEINQK